MITRMARTWILISSLLLSSLVSSTSFAQGWVSSGGELSVDSKNPWFLSNTPVVHFCIQIDRASFSATIDSARSSIQGALDYWKRELAQPWTSWGSQARSVMGKTEWIETDCALGVEDVHFKLGYPTLDAEELRQIDDPLRFVGLSIRKSYDRAALRAKGIVFIASDRGPTRYTDPSGQWVTDAWTKGTDSQLLRYVLIHELGHVMGLPHSGVGIMSEVFFDQVMNSMLAPIFWGSPIEGTFSSSPYVESCMVPIEVRSVLGIQTAESICLRLDISAGLQGNAVIWPLEWSPNTPSRNWQRLGAVSQPAYDLTDIRLTPAIQVRLPEEQTLFTGIDKDRGYVTIAHWIEASAPAVYRIEGSQNARAVRFAISPQSFELSAVIQGMPKPLLKWSSLLSRKLSIAQMGESHSRR